MPATVSPEVSLGGAILRLAIDSDGLEAQGATAEVAISALGSRERPHDPRVLQAFAEMASGANAFTEMREIGLREVASGMVLAEDLRSTTGVLLAPRGLTVTDVLVSRFRNFREGTVREPIRVLVAGQRGDKGTNRLDVAGGGR
jgi:hypothetical protein